MAIISGIPIDGEQAKMLREVIARARKYPEEWGELNLVEEPDGNFTIDDGDSILIEFIPDSRRVVVLNDGETYTGIEGCVILEVPYSVEDEDYDTYVKDHAEEGLAIDKLDTEGAV